LGKINNFLNVNYVGDFQNNRITLEPKFVTLYQEL